MMNKYFDFMEEFYCQSVIRKEGSKFCIFSKKGKKLGCFSTEKEAKKRLLEIEFFKRQ